MSTQQGSFNTYIGARYVPIFDGQWDNTKKYEPLVVVEYQGNSYTSKTYVPIGVDINNTDYWASTGNYNAQVEAYRKIVEDYKKEVDTYRINSVNWINAIQIGCDPTGTTPINDVINNFQFASSNVLYFPTGTYLLEDQLTLNNICVYGDNAIIKLDNLKTHALVMKGNNLYLKGIEFNTNAKCVEFQNGNNILIEDCIIHTQSIQGGNYQYGVTFNNCKNIKCNRLIINQPVDPNATSNNADGIHIYGGCENITITNIIGISGDDLIAINSPEPTGNNAPIKNVYIDNLISTLNNEKGARCIRLYANKSSLSNITITNSYLATNIEETRPLIITNASEQGGDSSLEKCTIDRLYLSNCVFDTPSQALLTSYANIEELQIIDCKFTGNLQFHYSIDSDINRYICRNLNISNVFLQTTAGIIGKILLNNSVLNNNAFNNLANIDTVIVNECEINDYLFSLTTKNINNIFIDKCKITTNNQSLHPINIAFNTKKIVLTNNIYSNTPSIFRAEDIEMDILIAEGNSYDIVNSVNTIYFLNPNTRFKGLDIISQSAPLKAFNGDRYIKNNSGTFEIYYYDYNAWNKLTSTPVT